jgi:crotonobetainyl-CoA:carnitine CoA-transferase CaiB-like acyl-CoA transferase
LLADLGAEVIKVETPLAGDYSRLAPAEMGLGGLFESINRGKKSLALNYRNPRGRDIFLSLCKRSDVVLEGFRPGVADKFGIGYKAVSSVNADIIYCSLSGYGAQGPYRDRAGHDLNYVAIGGALGLNAAVEGKPLPFGVPVADLSGAMLAAIAILGALVGRERNQGGRYLDVALLDGVLSWVTPLAGAAYFSGLEVAAGSHPLLGGQACFNVYETADGKFLSLAALEPGFWGDFCNAVGRPDWIERQFESAIHAELTELFLERSLGEWLDLFAGTDACVEPVNTFKEMLSHPQVLARGHVREQGGEPVGMNSPFAFISRGESAAPKLGEHTAEILQTIGVDPEEIRELADRRVIAL